MQKTNPFQRRLMLLGISTLILFSKISYADNTESPVTGSLTVTSNYVYRGVTNSNNLPAVQGSLTYTFLSTGIYANLWMSNCYQIAQDGSIGNVEVDAIFGVTNDLGDNFTYNFAVERYSYPKATSLNYVEFIGTIQYYFFTALYAYSANAYNVHAPSSYYNVGVTYDIPQKYVYFTDVNFSAAVGHYALPYLAGNSYNDYAITLQKKINKTYSIALGWTDTNHRFTNNSWDDSKIIATLTAVF